MTPPIMDYPKYTTGNCKRPQFPVVLIPGQTHRLHFLRFLFSSLPRPKASHVTSKNGQPNAEHPVRQNLICSYRPCVTYHCPARACPSCPCLSVCLSCPSCLSLS